MTWHPLRWSDLAIGRGRSIFMHLSSSLLAASLLATVSSPTPHYTVSAPSRGTPKGRADDKKKAQRKARQRARKRNR